MRPPPLLWCGFFHRYLATPGYFYGLCWYEACS